MAGFTLDQVRQIATSHKYKEISCNETSRVISFRDKASGSIRINVYYSTCTVGTCLNHPSRGKTQLFRRNVNLEGLKRIFANPRTHTGAGYYRKNVLQQWKTQDGSYECDSARRWRFVAATSGLSTKEYEINEIAKFCSSYDALLWKRGDPPSLTPDNLNGTEFSCGARSGLLRQLMIMAKGLTGGTVHCCKYSDLKKYESGDIRKGDIEQEEVGLCCKEAGFLEAYTQQLKHLSKLFSKFRKCVKIALLQWFVARDNCGFVLADADFKMLETEFDDEIDATHLDYAAMMYPKKHYLCKYHGVLEN